MITVLMREQYSCKKFQYDGLIVWFSGHLYNQSHVYLIIDYLSKTNIEKISIKRIKGMLLKLRGNFSITIKSEYWVFSFVDRIRSFPIFYSKNSNFIIGNFAYDIKDLLDLKDLKPDKLSLTAFSMSGYTIGNKTLIKEVLQLEAGGFLLFHDDKIYTNYYYSYSPWKIKNDSKTKIKNNLSDVIITVIEDMYKNVDGRQIVVPLSAGYDSRLIVSTLKEIGVKDVVCFSYGRKNSFESKTSKEIARKLGYRWVNVPVTIKSQKHFFDSEIYKEYLTLFDSYASVPAVQDISEVYYIKANKLIDKDAVFVNGNSGDFITGGHVPSNILKVENNNIENLLDIYFNKHYSLWECLKTPESKDIIISGLYDIMNQRDIPKELPIDCSHGIIESIEYTGRQTSYVIDQQNSYKFSGYDCRLPLWDNIFMDFWESVPYNYKVNQSLYKEVLLENNWGGVWSGYAVNSFDIRPFWLKTIRAMTKLLLAPLGRENWHKVERNVFTYWLDISCNSAITPYSKVILDRRGQRHFVSWLADQYLISHKLGGISCQKKREYDLFK
jgi:asparagine synthase (glutamine-hydrolysing)